MSVGLWCVAYELNMIVKQMFSAWGQHQNESSWNGLIQFWFGCHTFVFVLCWPLPHCSVFLKRLIRINDVCFPYLIFSHHLLPVFLPFQRDHVFRIFHACHFSSSHCVTQLNLKKVATKKVLPLLLHGKSCHLPVNKELLSLSIFVVFAVSSPGFFTNLLSSCWPTAYL